MIKIYITILYFIQMKAIFYLWEGFDPETSHNFV